MKRLRLALLAAALPLAACGGDPPPDAPGLSPSEEQALNDAAEMLDANAVSIEAVTENSTGGDR